MTKLIVSFFLSVIKYKYVLVTPKFPVNNPPINLIIKGIYIYYY